MNAIHLFTFRGIPVFVSPMYFLLLVMFGYRDPAQGIIWAIAITLSLLVHEFGHALVARRLRHEPTIMLHGFGGLTARSRRGRDVDEAAIVAMGPAAGLALGLLAFGMWQLAIVLGPSIPLLRMIRPLLYTCILWNLLNLLPLWPLDGGQLFQLGLGRLVPAQRAARITHIVALGMIAFLALFALQHGMLTLWSGVILLMLGMQNVQGYQGRAAAEESAAAPRTNSLAGELVSGAAEALQEGNYKEAARRAHQARAQEGVSQAMMEKIWEILGLATEQLGEYEEALAYLRRARPNERVRTATERCLAHLGRTEELGTMEQRWATTAKTIQMRPYLIGALTFISVAIAFVFISPIYDILFW